MSDLNLVLPAKWSNINANSALINIETRSGFGMYLKDEKGKEYLFDPQESHAVLGAALLDCLAHSRRILPEPLEGSIYPPDIEFDLEFDNYEIRMKHYEEWVGRLLAFTGAKTKSKLFRKMKNCGVTEQNGLITLKPWHHIRSDSWDREGISESDDVVIHSHSTPEEVGVAIRLALSRCT